VNLIDRPGTPQRAWDSWPALRQLPPAEPLAWSSAVVVAAHPDDEVLGAGGLLAMLAAAGARLRLIAVTDGEASHPDADPALIARVRTAETAKALEILGVGGIEVIRLGFGDTAVAGREEELASILAEQCAGFGVCLAPWEGDGHADHEAAGRAARRAARLAPGCPGALAYPVWMWHWAAPGDPRVPWHRACRVDLRPDVVARKRVAIRAFASQLADRGNGGGDGREHWHENENGHWRGDGRAVGPVLSAGVVAHFTTGQEVLLR
jgi:LmbE family N-acetylglucosaminyl deacetylase